jgi:Flp pilus assembly protein TadD
VLVVGIPIALYQWTQYNRRNVHPDNLAELGAQARSHPMDLPVQLDWGSALATAGHLDEAAEVFAHAAQIAPNDPRPYTLLGAVALRAHKTDYALANFRRSVELQPANPDVWHVLGDLYTQGHARRQALAAYEQALKLRPNDEVALRQLGVLATEANQLARGYQALEHAVTLDPKDMRAQADLGSCALAMGRLPDAKQAFETVLAQDPHSATALVGSAEVAIQLAPLPHTLTAAEQQVEQAIGYQDSAHAHLVLGRIKLTQRAYPQAVQQLTLSLRLNADQPIAYGYLSQAYAGMGRPDLARKASADYQRADAQAHGKSQHSASEPNR